MNPIKPRQDLVPLSEFRANVSELLKQTQHTQRPIVITQHGRGAGVMMSADLYERLLDEIEMLHAISQGQAEIAHGNTVPHEQVMDELKQVVADAKKKKRKSRRSGKDAA